MKKILCSVLLLQLIVGCSFVKKTVVKDIPLEQQKMLIEKYADKAAWTRLIVEDLKQRGVVQRDVKVTIADLDFHWSGSVTVLTEKRKRIVYGLNIERPLTVEKIESRLDEVFWFDSPMLRHVSYIRTWGKKTAQAIRNHEVFIGMAGDAALESWGVPTKLNVTDIAGKKEEQWVYTVGKRSKYIYIIDNKVSKWED
ncbi:MAG: hypothetical protein HY770_02260 [Chitinivibrionia bacterium]|nr:hypothetical protein [Chitinivibrionia bacterium]